MIQPVQQPIINPVKGVTSAVPLEQKLPAESAIVAVKVLERVNENFKLLVDGSVFQAKLPIPMGDQETFLAKVVGRNPLTLQADGMFMGKALTQNILMTMLQKMGLQDSELNKDLMETLLRRKKPVIKSKFDALQDLLTTEKRPDELQSVLLVGLYLAPQNEIAGFKREAKRIFEESIHTIIEKIFHLITIIADGNGRSLFLKDAVEQTFLSGRLLPLNPSRRIIDVVKYLSDKCRQHRFTAGGDEISMARELSVLLTEYLLHKSVYHRFGVFIDFSVNRISGEFMLSLFQHTKELSDDKFSVSADLLKNVETPLQIRGTLKGKSGHLVCFSKLKSRAAKFLYNFDTLLRKNGYEATVLLQDFTITGASTAPAMSSINYKA